ncbi:MAG: L-lysine 6-transaminase [Bacteroidetes bacterium]|nr:L-lysine 6-transaminase [Bacteroidota bacterium]
MENNKITHQPINDYKKYNVSPEDVHSVIGKHMLADGFDIVLDLKKSKGVRLIDAKTGDEYLDLFTFFASNALGLNHPKINNIDFHEELVTSAVNKPSNSDIYTQQMASFVNTFAHIAKPDYMKHLFFISGGGLAVENGLKIAFDWKVQKNFEKGIKEEKGFQVIHFKEAFHGRTGYTMSLTNTDPTKVKYYPKFDWPRITNPKAIFPIENNLEQIIASENKAITEINEAIKNNPDDIAVIIIEPIQGEGGDNLFRKEFFLKLRDIADENEIMLMFDEVQTGFGLTGKFWASDYYVQPDIISFGKKAQVCGIMVSERVDEIENNCFNVSSRINSTWGGNLTDMVRSKRILEIIEEENLVENARLQGDYLLENLHKIQEDFPSLISNARGLGLMCSFDLPDGDTRNKFTKESLKEKLLILGCGEKSIRFRPPLNITKEELDEGFTKIKLILKSFL